MMEQEIGLGMHVYTSDKQDIGAINRLILDPATGRVKAAVIRQGSLLPRDVEVQRERMTPRPGGAVDLSYTADQVSTLPDFEPASYTTPPPDFPVPEGFARDTLYLPLGYGMGPAPAMPPLTAVPGAMADDAESREIRAAWYKQDLDNAVVKEGSKVVSRDGEKVGEIEQLLFDPRNGELTRIVVRKGFIFTKEAEIPASMVSEVDDGTVAINASAQEIKNLMA